MLDKLHAAAVQVCSACVQGGALLHMSYCMSSVLQVETHHQNYCSLDFNW